MEELEKSRIKHNEDTHQYLIRVPKSIFEKLGQLSDQEGVSINWIINKIIKKGLKKAQK